MKLWKLLPVACSLAVLSLLALALGRTDDEKKPPAEEKKAEPAEKAEPGLNPLEKKFVEDLSGATLKGRWCLVSGDKLGEEKEDRYTISSATKLGGDTWIISARVQYGTKDVTVPVPVKVLWAGDTPVISVTKLGIPGLGTYTARVMIYEGLYSGTWSGPGHGGLMSGALVKAEGQPEKKAGEKPAGKAEG